MSDKIHTIHSDEHPPHEAGTVTGEIVDGFAQEQGLGAVIIDMTTRLDRRHRQQLREERRARDEQRRESLAVRIEQARTKLGELIAEFRKMSGVHDDTLPIVRSIDRGELKVKIISRSPKHLRIDTFEQSEGDTVSLRLGDAPRVSQTTRFSGDERYELLGGSDEAIVLDDMIENLTTYLEWHKPQIIDEDAGTWYKL